MAHYLKAFLADQIRALRGDRSQVEFGQLIGKPQSVVSRLEDEEYGKVTLQTLISIAEKLDVALIVRFVDFPTFLRLTNGSFETAEAPAKYDQHSVDDLVQEKYGPHISPGLSSSVEVSEQNYANIVVSPKARKIQVVFDSGQHGHTFNNSLSAY